LCDYLAAKARSADLGNIDCVVASAVSLPLVDATVDLIVSNYSFHHLSDEDKHRALAEIRRVLRPGGRLVSGDMMFRVSLGEARDRRVISQKVRAIALRGPAGVVRPLRNGVRFAEGESALGADPHDSAESLSGKGTRDYGKDNLGDQVSQGETCRHRGREKHRNGDSERQMQPPCAKCIERSRLPGLIATGRGSAGR